MQSRKDLRPALCGMTVLRAGIGSTSAQAMRLFKECSNIMSIPCFGAVHALEPAWDVYYEAQSRSLKVEALQAHTY